MKKLSRKKRREYKKIQALTEGAKANVDLENLLFAQVNASNIGGISNSYSTYASQVIEGYRKYNSEATWGNQQFRSLVDIRTSFIAGEGLSIAAKNEKFIKWLEKFAKKNKVFASGFFDAVLGSELTGKCLYTLSVPAPGEIPKVIRIPYTRNNAYKIVLSNQWDPNSVSDVVKDKKGGGTESLGLTNFVYIRTGGDDTEVNNTTTKAGATLNDCENYDRAIKDIRRLNHVLARITPTFTTKGENETNKLVAKLKAKAWKIGQAFIGTAKFAYETVGTGAHSNLESELSTCIKNISALTGVPVHWVGWVDLVSNKALGESLYDTIGNATIRERTLFAEGIYDLIVKAQELYIDAGGTDISQIEYDFEVRIPVVDFSQFLETVKALSTAFNDGVISKDDYQNQIPGINPLLTNKALKQEERAEEKKMLRTTKINIIPEEEEKT